MEETVETTKLQSEADKQKAYGSTDPSPTVSAEVHSELNKNAGGTSDERVSVTSRLTAGSDLTIHTLYTIDEYADGNNNGEQQAEGGASKSSSNGSNPSPSMNSPQREFFHPDVGSRKPSDAESIAPLTATPPSSRDGSDESAETHDDSSKSRRTVRVLSRSLALLVLVGGMVFLNVQLEKTETQWKPINVPAQHKSFKLGVDLNDSRLITLHIHGRFKRVVKANTIIGVDLSIQYPPSISCLDHGLDLALDSETLTPTMFSQFCSVSDASAKNAQFSLQSHTNITVPLLVRVELEFGDQNWYFAASVLLLTLNLVLLHFRWLDQFIAVSLSIVIGLAMYHYYQRSEMTRHPNSFSARRHAILWSQTADDILLLIGLSLIANQLSRTKFYQWLAQRIALLMVPKSNETSAGGEQPNNSPDGPPTVKATKTNIRRLIVLGSIVAFLSATLFGSLATVILLSRLVLSICDRQHVIPQVLMIQLAIFSNLGMGTSALSDLLLWTRFAESKTPSGSLSYHALPAAVIVLVFALVVQWFTVLSPEDYKPERNKNFVIAVHDVKIAEKLADGLDSISLAGDKVKGELNASKQQTRRELRLSQTPARNAANAGEELNSSDEHSPQRSFHSLTSTQSDPEARIVVKWIEALYIITILLLILAGIAAFPWLSSVTVLTPGMMALGGATAVLIFSPDVSLLVSRLDWYTVAFVLLYTLLTQVLSSEHSLDMLGQLLLKIDQAILYEPSKDIATVAVLLVSAVCFSCVLTPTTFLPIMVPLFKDICFKCLKYAISTTLGMGLGSSLLVFSSIPTMVLVGQCRAWCLEIEPLVFLKYSAPTVISCLVASAIYLILILTSHWL